MHKCKGQKKPECKAHADIPYPRDLDTAPRNEGKGCLPHVRVLPTPISSGKICRCMCSLEALEQAQRAGTGKMTISFMIPASRPEDWQA